MHQYHSICYWQGARGVSIFYMENFLSAMVYPFQLYSHQRTIRETVTSGGVYVFTENSGFYVKKVCLLFFAYLMIVHKLRCMQGYLFGQQNATQLNKYTLVFTKKATTRVINQSLVASKNRQNPERSFWIVVRSFMQFMDTASSRVKLRENKSKSLRP